MKNRFNNITSKEWLPYQKSWFLHESDVELYEKTVRFFLKFDDEAFPPNMYFSGSQTALKTCKNIAEKNKANVFTNAETELPDSLQYILFDLRDQLLKKPDIVFYDHLKQEIIRTLRTLFNRLKHRRFVSVLIPNLLVAGRYLPFAWDLSYTIASGLSLKDEKIGCQQKAYSSVFSNDIFVMLNFRKDEHATGEFVMEDSGLFRNNTIQSKDNFSGYYPARWEIIKPKARNKKEVLHPAKYPEELIERFIEVFTKKNDNVFDPMSGTGSSQFAAIRSGRNGYGTELSSFFAEIANQRLSEFQNPTQKTLDFFTPKKNNARFKILNKDAKTIAKNDFPQIDYLITSPPYWDMLNMKGAENQAKRKQKGLKLNYSDDKNDFGNISDYAAFINELCKLYFNLDDILRPGAAITIIVKNIKKKGKNYPFAYDLAKILQEKWILLPEFYWLQDDINLAPYGYGNTFVSNTFHQYCLNFLKP